jgi:hypothetical protein
MNTTLAHAPTTPRRPIGTIVGVVAVAIAMAVVFFGVSRLVGSPDVVDRIEIRNPTGDVVDVLARADERSAEVPVAIVEPNRRAVAQGVIDQGDTWIFVFRVSGEAVGEIRMSRTDLERAHWRITVPSPDVAAPGGGAGG